MIKFNIRPKSVLAHILPVVICFFLVSCGHANVSRLLPEIEPLQITAVNHTFNTAAYQDKGLHRKLPKMTAAEYERIGDSLIVQGELDTAYLNYDKALQLAPGNTDLEYKKGLALLKAGNTVAALKQFQMVLDKKQDHALAQEGMGRVLLLRNNIEVSQAHFVKAVTLNDRLWLSYTCLGAIYDKKELFNAAITAYNAALALQPDNGMLYNNLGVSYMLANQYEMAFHAFRNAISHRFATEKTYNNIGLALAHMGHYTAAFSAFKRSGSEAKAYNNLGCYFMKTGDVRKAIAYFEKAVDAHPSYYVTAGKNLKQARAAAKKMMEEQGFH